VLFAGAGCSGPSFPGWTALLVMLEDLCDTCGKGFSRDHALRDSNPLLYADRMKEHICSCKGDLGRYHKFMFTTFGADPRIEQFHYDLVALPFRGVVTTNYDRAIELALASIEPLPIEKTIEVTLDPPHVVWTFHRSVSSRTAPRLVAHLHGYYKHPETIVLSESDYVSAYGWKLPALGGSSGPTKSTGFARQILGDAGRPAVFVGFSLRDEYLTALLGACADTSQLWDEAIHFAVLGTTPATYASDSARADRLRSDYGIQVVFYEVKGGSHQPLYDLVADYRRQVAPAVSPPLVRINERMAEDMRE
jgi:hypothetical protein